MPCIDMIAILSSHKFDLWDLFNSFERAKKVESILTEADSLNVCLLYSHHYSGGIFEF